jgi:predicted enzyme related to lactoylglutathione lyase
MAQTATARRARSQAQDQPLWSHGKFHWNELLARDVEGAKRFYRDTIGWSFDSMQTPDGGTYWRAMQNGQPVAGIFPLTSPDYDGICEGWMSYLAVDDVDARVAKAVEAGAELMKPIFDVPDVGRIAILTEPGGAGVGWITPVGPQAR